MKFDLSSFALFSAATVLGIATLFAYNSFFASPSYLERYYQFAAVKDIDDVRRLPTAKLAAWKSITTWSTVLQSIPMFLMQIVMLTPFMLKLNIKTRMIGSAIFLLIAMLLLPVCSAAGGVSENGALAVLFISCVLSGLSTCVLQSSFFAFFGTMPTIYVTGFIFGSGLSGPINSVLRIIIAVGLPSTFHGVKTGAAIFFSLGMGLMALSVVIVLLLRYNAIVVKYSSAYRDGRIAAQELDESGVSSDVAKPSRRQPEVAEPKAVEEEPEAANAVSSRSKSLQTNSPEATVAQTAAEPEAEQQLRRDSNALLVIRKIWPMMVCLAVNMFTTLLLFPGIGLAAMHSDGGDASGDDSGSDSSAAGAKWKPEAIMPMVVVLVFNLGDTVGRGLSNIRALWLSKRNVIILTAFRIVACVIPLFLGAVKQKYINSNVNPIIIFIFLGLTGGYIVGVTMAYGNGDKRLTSEMEHATAATCMCFSLLFGITFGSIVSLLIVNFAINN